MEKEEKERLKSQIISHMGVGIENIRKGEFFIKLFGITRRNFTNLITELREEYPIVSRKTEPHGYYIATHDYEIADYIINLQNYVEGCNNTIKTMKKYLNLNREED